MRDRVVCIGSVLPCEQGLLFLRALGFFVCIPADVVVQSPMFYDDYATLKHKQKPLDNQQLQVIVR